MRRLAVFALCGTLALSACGDQSRESPTEPSAPSPDALLASCQVERFPIVRVSALILKVFPAGRLRVEALARAGIIALFWNTCHPREAQKGVVDFVDWMNRNFQAGRLIGTNADRSLLITTMFAGVGLSSPPATNLGADYGVGFFDPSSTSPTLVKTTSGVALIELQPGSFNEPTTIVVSRNPDNFLLTNFSGSQFPPGFDYNAINTSGNHVLQNGQSAIVAFCLLNSDFVTYPANRRIGHNPVAGAPGAPFEILDPVELAGHPDLVAALNCGNLAPTPTVIGGFGPGLPGIANAAWRTAGHYLGPVTRALFLPEALNAATLGTLPPPIGGRAPSLSPFKVVSPTDLSISSGNNQEGFTNQILTAPLVVQVSQGETPVGGAVVTFQVTGGGGGITSSATTNALGRAEATWTLGSTVGSQTATASTPGASPVTFTATATDPPPVRAVLQWGATPSDLDFHLTGPTATAARFHVYYDYDSRGSLTSAPFASLDRDDTNAFGPETITISQLATGGPYRFSVHDYSNLGASATYPSQALANSGATVTVYLASGAPQVFNVPTGEGVNGTLWTVFTLEEGTIMPVNTMSYTSDPSSTTAFSILGRTISAVPTDAALIRDAATRNSK